MGVRVVTGVNQTRGACRGNQGLFTVFAFGVSRRVYLGLFRTLVARSAGLVVSPRGPTERKVAGREVASRGLKRGLISGLETTRMRGWSIVRTD